MAVKSGLWWLWVTCTRHVQSTCSVDMPNIPSEKNRHFHWYYFLLLPTPLIREAISVYIRQLHFWFVYQHDMKVSISINRTFCFNESSPRREGLIFSSRNFRSFHYKLLIASPLARDLFRNALPSFRDPWEFSHSSLNGPRPISFRPKSESRFKFGLLLTLN